LTRVLFITEQPTLTLLKSKAVITPFPFYPLAKSRMLSLAMGREPQVRNPYF